jgi:hypothetical protein
MSAANAKRFYVAPPFRAAAFALSFDLLSHEDVGVKPGATYTGG